MKFCYNCGAKLKNGAKFCGECGTELAVIEKDEKGKKVVKEAKIDEEKEKKTQESSSLKGSYYNENIKTSKVVNESKEDENIPTYICIASLIFTFLGSLIPIARGLSLLIGLGLMVYVRIVYPKSTFGKVLMWLYIVFYTIVIILIILLVVACSRTCEGFISRFF